MKRRHFIRIVAILAMAIVLWCVWSRSDPDEVEAIHAVDDETAVVLWREHVGVVDAKGTMRWRKSLPGDSYSYGPYSGLATTGDVVAVRYGHREDDSTVDHALAAYSLHDGKLLWDIVLAKYTPKSPDQYPSNQPSLDVYISSLVVDEKLVMFTDTGAGRQIDTIDPKTGKVLFTQPREDAGSYSPAIIGPRVFTHRVHKTIAYDIAAKTATHLETSYEGCAIGDAYITIETGRDEYTPILVAYAHGELGRRRAIADPFQPLGARRVSLRRCGQYRDRMVLLLEVSEDHGYKTETVVVAITDAAGTVLHTIDLGRDMMPDWKGAVSQRYPLAASLSGELTRFVPYVQDTLNDNERTPSLIMLDLEEGKIAWAAPKDDRARFMSVFRAGTRWFTYGSRVLSSFDGETGELTASMELHDVGEVHSYHAAGDRIWIHGSTSTARSEPAIGALDSKTLTGFVRGITITDVTATTRAKLGR